MNISRDKKYTLYGEPFTVLTVTKPGGECLKCQWTPPIAQPVETTQKPNAWRVSGTNRLYDQYEAEQEAKRCGGNTHAYPVYAEPQSVEPDLVAAAQAVLDRWNSPQWEWVKCGPTGDLMHVLRSALDAQSLMPVNNHTLLLAEAYQVVGSLLSDMGQFDTDKGQKVLDNLSQGRMVHNDVLPWPSFAKVVK